jgi:cystathionine beta-synthase
MDVRNNILETIGNTPLVRLHRIGSEVPCDLIAKVEAFNPGGSVKDRIGIEMIRAAEAEGKLKAGGTVVECTSGNTGMGLALAAAVLGYRAVFTMPDKMSLEKIHLLKALGADVFVAPTAVPPDSPESYYKVAERIVEETPGAFHTNQYHNQANPESHYKTTGPELWRQTAGRITHFVAGLGTGGTISGAGRYLKEQNPDVKVIGVDPIGSILHEYFYTKNMGEAKPYKVEGVGEDIVPTTTHFQYVDEVVQVTDKESFHYARRLAREEGILGGGSCGLAVAGAVKALGKSAPDDVAVVLLPDTGERYLSKLYNDEWMRDNGFLEPRSVSIRDVLDSKAQGVPRLVCLSPEQTVREAIARIREHDISFIPVIEGTRNAGTLAENAVMRAVLEDPSALDAEVRTLMHPPLKSLSPDDSVEAAMRSLAAKDPAVLVVDAGTPVGILTRTDVIGFISH